MKSREIFGLAALSILFICSVLEAPVYADGAVKAKKVPHKTSASTAVKWPQVCPVSGEKIASAADAVGSSVYDGKTYYFCCSMCKPAFDKDPKKYAAAAAKGKYLQPM